MEPYPGAAVAPSPRVWTAPDWPSFISHSAPRCTSVLRRSPACTLRWSVGCVLQVRVSWSDPVVAWSPPIRTDGEVGVSRVRPRSGCTWVRWAAATAGGAPPGRSVRTPPPEMSSAVLPVRTSSGEVRRTGRRRRSHPRSGVRGAGPGRSGAGRAAGAAVADPGAAVGGGGVDRVGAAGRRWRAAAIDGPPRSSRAEPVDGRSSCEGGCAAGGRAAEGRPWSGSRGQAQRPGQVVGAAGGGAGSPARDGRERSRRRRQRVRTP